MDIAVKVLADNHSLDPEIRERFLSEGRLLRRIDSRWLIQVHDVGETSRHQPFLVLELADGGDLSTRVERLRAAGWQPSPADVDDVVTVLVGAASALHDGGLVHRDISPTNVLIRTTIDTPESNVATLIAPSERLIVSDLGLAKDLSANSGLTAAGGTDGFSAPEQARIGRIDARADVYAIARVVEWLIGAAGGGSRTELAAALKALGPALESDADKRPESAADLGHAIQQALRTAAPVVEHSPRKVARFVLASLALAGLLVAWLIWPSADLDRLPDGRVVVSVEIDATTTRLIGPAEIEVGSSGRFIVEGDAGRDLHWILPGDATYDGVTEVEVSGVSPGSGVVRVEVSTDDGTVELLELPFSIVEKPS